MDLELDGRQYVICGAGSGFGRAIARQLAAEGAMVLAIARSNVPLQFLENEYPGRISTLQGDLFDDTFIRSLSGYLADRKPEGIVINAAGPPAKSFLETVMDDWDDAYRQLLRWKVQLVKEVLPLMIQRRFGRIVFIESVSVKQPVPNLVLSNAIRLAVVGMAKTLANETGHMNITVNVIAPGYHDTPAMERLFAKRSMSAGIPVDEARKSFEKELMMGKMGNPDDLARLALWLLSPISWYVTGQTFSVDGGMVKHVFG